MKSLLIPIFALLSLATHAAAVHSCNHLDSIGNLVGNVRSFAQGAIRVAYVDTEEPTDRLGKCTEIFLDRRQTTQPPNRLAATTRQPAGASGRLARTGCPAGHAASITVTSAGGGWQKGLK